MSKIKVLRGIAGFSVALLPILGWLFLIGLLLTQKKSKYLFIPLLCGLLFIIIITVEKENRKDRNSLQASLPPTIENRFFSISFSSAEKLTIEQFSNNIRSILPEDLEPERLSEKNKLPKIYQRLIDKFYILYETEFLKFRATDVSFYIPITEKETIRSEIISFSNDYAQIKHPDSNFYFISRLLFVLLWIFIIPFTTYMFYNYSDIDGRDISDSNINENCFPTNTTQPNSVKINEIPEAEIQKQLNLTAIQAKMILAERDTNGAFHNFSDFLKRTGLSERLCNQFKERLDFSFSSQSNTQSGRLLDI